MAGTADNAAPLRRLMRHTRAHRRTVRQAVVCSVLNKLWDLAPPVLIGAAVDIVVERERSLLGRLGIEDLHDQLIVLAVLTVAIWAAESVFEYLQKILWRNLAQTIQHELRVEAYEHVQGLELSYFEDRSTGGLLSILNDDINQLERFLDSGANDLLQVTTTAITISAAFFFLAPGVATLAILPVPVVIWGSFTFQRRIAPRYDVVRQRVAELNGLLANNLSGVATIKSFTAEAREAERVRERSERYLDANRHAIRLSSAFSPLIRMAIVVGFTATLVVGGMLALDGELSVGAYSVMVFLTQRLLWPLTQLGTTFDLFQRAMASTKRVLDLLDTPVGIVGGERALPRDDVRGSVLLDGVDFTYRDGTQVLFDVTLRAEPGETVAIVGPTGSGKTSIVKLLLRFYDVSAGSVRIDGIDVRELDLAALRRAIGLVSQDVFLFDGTVRANITYGADAAVAQDRVDAAAGTAEARGFVDALPQRFDTLVGERGQRLSGGQRQRLSIARALLDDPPILLLDEATSAVDNETEAAIQRSLERIAVGRTTIVIAHRLSTIRNADRIYVLDAGRVVESGTHAALVEADGAYAALWRVQTGVQGA